MTMYYVGKRRLLKLAAFLDKLPAHKFDFSLIMKKGTRTPLDALKHKEEYCGTAGCALGWCPKLFPKYVKWVKSDVSSRELSLSFPTQTHSYWPWSWSDAAKFFYINEYQAQFLFQPYVGRNNLANNATPKQVANHIRKFVEENS